MKCWYCGAEPTGTVDARGFGDPGPVLIPTGWPPSSDGHKHAERAPTPGELEQAGHEALMRIQTEMGG